MTQSNDTKGPPRTQCAGRLLHACRGACWMPRTTLLRHVPLADGTERSTSLTALAFAQVATASASLTSRTLSRNVSNMTNHETPDREILNLKEIEALTGISSRTWRFWRSNGETATPRSFKLGRGVYYKRADVEAWIEDRYQDGS